MALAIVYLLFCGSVFAIGQWLGKDPAIPPQALKTPAPDGAEIPVATIQLTPDINNMCRRLLFHNDTGRYDDGGTAHCENMTSKQFLVWTVTERTKAFVDSFRSKF